MLKKTITQVKTKATSRKQTQQFYTKNKGAAAVFAIGQKLAEQYNSAQENYQEDKNKALYAFMQRLHRRVEYVRQLD